MIQLLCPDPGCVATLHAASVDDLYHVLREHIRCSHDGPVPPPSYDVWAAGGHGTLPYVSAWEPEFADQAWRAVRQATVAMILVCAVLIGQLIGVGAFEVLR